MPSKHSADEVPHPAKTRVLTRKAHGADVRGAGLWPTGVHEAPWNAAREVPPIKNAGSRPQGVQRRCVLEYVSLWRTQRTRFRNSLLAALLYKIEKLGLSMHTDLHIDMSDVGLRRIE